MSAMGALDIVRSEVHAGLPRLRGGRVVVDIPIRQPVIDQVLGLVPGMRPDVSIAIGPDRQLQVRYGVFHANARLHASAVHAPAPVVVLELASQLIAWGLRSAPLPRFVRLVGRDIEIHLADVPALRDAAPLWRHVRQIAFGSTPGQLDVRVVLDID